MLSSPQGLVRYSRPFNNQYRYELGLSGILFHGLSNYEIVNGTKYLTTAFTRLPSEYARRGE